MPLTDLIRINKRSRNNFPIPTPPYRIVGKNNGHSERLTPNPLPPNSSHHRADLIRTRDATVMGTLDTAITSFGESAARSLSEFGNSIRRSRWLCLAWLLAISREHIRRTSVFLDGCVNGEVGGYLRKGKQIHGNTGGGGKWCK